MKYRITTQRQLRREFWATHPNVSQRKIPDDTGNGRIHACDTRCAFVDFIDCLSKSGEISQELAERATL